MHSMPQVAGLFLQKSLFLLSANKPLSAKEPIQMVLVRVITSQASPSQGGEDAQNALSCRSLSAKEPLIIVFG